MGIEGLEDSTEERAPTAEERQRRMKEREQEALAERERKEQHLAEENRARQIRQGVISDPNAESEEASPPSAPS